ncbi:hypothetical protein FAZ19_15780 [Sphingobacterium alkalisoli]|uniref:Lantibiotic dehydratase n=1 Tax=Sphingobacterium alkalisoli TaxID=1874115 RepID=A0A4V5LXS1_9SPHI|nr:lantibiotic dehydratase [Sphingobacterium alkalisoli]TJY63729.1 hypothetical protein FAZ19_15780 [Sphingobacterium alkalisoli]GGH25257.1 hypothetical protein GCM10011418_33750 [Sphingobacterium alkalisoli]
MKTEIKSTIIFRVPKCSTEATLEGSWNALKESIKISSTNFYELVADLAYEDISSATPEIQHTIWKYFNRSKYRATPYGTFAGVGIMDNKNSSNKPMIISEGQKEHSFPDWSQTEHLGRFGPLDAREFVLTNTSRYKAFGKTRYLLYENRKFHLSEIKVQKEVNHILRTCRKATPLSKLLEGSPDIPETLDLLLEMIQHQLVLTSEHPNIIGTDYFLRRQIPVQKKQPGYIISERPYISGTLPTRPLKHLPELANLLSLLRKKDKTTDLGKFIEKFRQRYDMKAVPLMEALDIEVGIGYGHLEDPEEAMVTSYLEKEENPIGLEDKLKGLLFGKKDLNNQPIDLSTLEFEGSEAVSLPNTLGVLCSLYDNDLVIEHIGGATVNSLAGRFSLIGGALHEYCRNMAELEQTANPDILFFDVGYAGEPDVDNVNRRAGIYDLQLSILSYDTSPAPLHLEDFMLSLRGNDLILFSKRLQKRLVPRIASAYNYGRSDLSVFRFLCDLQYQGITSDLSFSLSSLLPQGDYYPRINYKNIILSPAKWKVHYAHFVVDAEENEITNARKNLESLKLPRYLVSRTFDRTMTFDTDNNEDMGALLFILKKFRSITLEEGFIPQEPVVYDISGKPYHSQLLITLAHDKPLYKALPVRKSKPVPASQNFFLPGDNWLYLQLFVAPSLSNQLLVKHIKPYLKKNIEKISCWFFIRYNENGEHIRMRIRSKQPADYTHLFSAMTTVLEKATRKGLLQDVQVSTYRREMERYGMANMERVERYFQFDSSYVLDNIDFGALQMERYGKCVGFILFILPAYDKNTDAQTAFIDERSHSFCQEHRINADSYRMLNQQFGDFLKSVNIVESKLKDQWSVLKYELQLLLEPLDFEVKTSLLADILHMHFNRFFVLNQRTHEMQVYYFISKYLRYRKATGRYLFGEQSTILSV